MPEAQAGAQTAAEMGDALQLKNTLDATLLRLRADVTPPGANHVVTVDTTLDATDLSFTTDSNGRRHPQIVVAMLAATPDFGASSPQTSGVLNIDVDPPQYAELLTFGVRFRQQLPLPAGNGVAQVGTARVGTLMIPVISP